MVILSGGIAARFRGILALQFTAKEVFDMSWNAMMKGISVGASVGAACFMLISSKDRKKRSLKRKAGRMLKSAGDALSEMTDILK
jgi:acetyl-CoA acetyltransferase